MKRLNRRFYPSNTPDSKEIHIKKLYSFAFYVLVTPAITLSSGAQHDQATTQSTPTTAQNNQSTPHTTHAGSQTAANDQTHNQSRMQSRSYMGAAPDNGIRTIDLIGAEVKTRDDDAGSVVKLIY